MKNKKLLPIILFIVIISLTAFMLTACQPPTDNNGENGNNGTDNTEDTSFSVIFNTNGGSAVASQTYTKRSQVSVPVTPTRAGYTFDKWYSNEELTFEWAFESSWVSSETTLYAGWMVNSYYIRYNYQGATENITELTAYVQYDSEYTLVVPTRTGYVFDGWYSAANGGGVKYTGDNGVSLADWNIANSVNVYASWIPLSYELALNFDGGTFAGEPDGVFTVKYGQKFEVSVTPTKIAGGITYSFGGWYTAPEGRGLQITYNTGESLLAWNVPDDTTLYAKWVRTGSDLALITSTPSDMTLLQNKLDIVIPNANTTYAFSASTLAVSAGAHFSLYLDADLTEAFGTKTGTDPAYGYQISDITLGNTNFYLLVIAEDGDHRTTYQVTLKRNRMYQVTMNPGNGLDLQTFSVEESHPIPIPAEFLSLTRTGYSFNNWTNTVNNFEWDFNKGITSSLNLVGNWQANTYKVAFDTNSPLISPPSTRNILFDQTFSAVLPADPSLVGYLFDGWYDSIDMLGTRVISSTVFNIANNVILYAKWLPVFIFENYNEGISITGVGISGTSLTLPSSIDQKTVLKIDSFGVEPQLTSLVIDGKDIEISENAFIGCTNLSSLSLDGSLLSSASSSNWSFYGANAIKSVRVTGGAVPVYAFRNADNVSVTLGDGVKTETNDIVTITGGVTSIGDYAFYNCTGISSIEIPASVASVGASAFLGCANLKTVTMPANLLWDNRSNNSWIFYGADLVETVNITAGITSSVKNYAFYNAKNIKNLSFGTEITQIGDYACANMSVLSSIYVPSEVEVIGSFAFYNCSNAQSLLFASGSKIKTIGNSAFAYCNNINQRELTLPATLISIGKSAFYNLLNVQRVIINNAACSIGSYAFAVDSVELNSKLYYVSLGTSVTRIDSYAFKNLVALSNINLPTSLLSIGVYAYENCKAISAITIPFSVREIGEGAFSGTSLSTIKVDSGSLHFISDDNVLYDYNKSVLLAYGTAKTATGFTVPGTVTRIGNNAFYGATKLTAISLSSGLKEIGNYAFSNCRQIANVNLGNYFVKLGDNAFSGCNMLTYVQFGNYSIESVGSNVFFGTHPDLTLYIPTNTLTDYLAVSGMSVYSSIIKEQDSWYGSYSIANVVGGVEITQFKGSEADIIIPRLLNQKVVVGISDYAFYNKSTLKKVSFADSSAVSYIGASAFEACPYLTDFVLPAALTSLGTKAFYGCTSLINVSVESGNVNFSAESGVLYNLDKSELILYPAGLTATSFTAPISVKAISSYAFSNTKVSSVIFGSSLQTVRAYAFYNANELTSFAASGSNLTSIGNSAFFACAKLNSVNLPANIVSIGSYAFYGCSALSETSFSPLALNDYANLSVIGSYAFSQTAFINPILPQSVKEIAPYLFYKTASLTNIGFSDTITSIGEYSFAYTSISEITVPDSVTFIGWNAFYNCSNLSTVNINKNTSELSQIGSYAFYNCSLLASITLPDSLTNIGSYAFYNNTSLSSLIVPDSLSGIAAYAFYGCSSLESLTFGLNSSLQYIMDYAFAGGNILSSVTLPKSLSLIGDSAFSDSSDLIEVLFGDGSSLVSVGVRAFYNNVLLSGIFIPEGTVSIGNEAFMNCAALVSVSVPSSVTSIGNDVFKNTAWLSHYYGDFIVVGDILYHYDGDEENVVIPSGVKAIGDNAFYGKNSIVSVSIPASVESIGNRAFNGCTSLESVSVEASSQLKYIGASAFMGATLLSTFDLPTGLLTIGDNAFYGCNSLVSYALPSTVTSLGSYAFYDCVSLTDFVINNATLAISEYAFAFSSPDTSSLANFDMGDSVTKINAFAFYQTSSLNELTIADSVKEIGESAFQNSALTTLIINSSSTLLKIGKNAFNGCSNLVGNAESKLVLPASLTEIGNYAFYNCVALSEVTIENASLILGNYVFGFSLSSSPLLSVVYVGNAIKEIGEYAFYNAKQLTVISESDIEAKLPESLTAIRKNAFSGCVLLASIILPDNISSIGENAFYDTSALTSVSLGVGSLFNNDGNLDWKFYGAENIKNVTITASASSEIPSYAFYNANILESVTLLNSVTKIGDYAFYGATSLSQLNYEDINASQLAYIGDYAFASGNLIESLNFGPNLIEIGNHAFYNCDSLTTVSFTDSAAYILDYAFSLDDTLVSSLTYVDFGNALKGIGNYSFKDNTALYSNRNGETSLTIPNSVLSIGESAFYNNSSLTDIDLSTQLAFIPSYAFAYCDALTSISIPSAVVSINEGAFRGCSSLSVLDFEVGSLMNDIGAYAFENSGLIGVTVPNGISNIGNYSFANIPSLLTFAFEGDINTVSLTTISEGFISGSSLSVFIIPDSVESIGNYAFKNSVSLARLIISDTSNISYVGDEVFYGCSSLLSTYDELSENNDLFALPDSVVYLGSKVFFNASSITKLSLPSGLDFVGENTLEGMSTLTELHLPIFAGGYVENTPSYLRYYFGAKVYNSSNIIIPDTLISLYVNNAVDNLSYAFYRSNKIQNVYFEDVTGLTEIGNRAFYNTEENRSLKNLYFIEEGETLTNKTPSGLIKIGTYAFYNCRELLTLTLNDGLIEIGSYAFAYCHKFTSFSLPWSVTSVGLGILQQLNENEGMMTTLTVHLNATYLINTPSFVKYFFGASQPTATVYMPFRLTTINLIGKYDTLPAYAFYGCSGVTTINLPSEIVSIGASAFENCTLLTSINFAKLIVPEEPELPYEITLLNSLPEKITSVGASAFKNCVKLTSMVLTDSVSFIGKGIFEGATLLATVEMPFVGDASFLKYFYGAVAYTDTIDLPAALKNITIVGDFDSATGAFYNCKNIASVDISDTTALNVLGDNAFSGCSLLTAVTLPLSLTSIGASAFYNCSMLASISLPENLVSIGESAFYGCVKLLSVTVPAKVTTISSNAFRGCTLLENCYFATELSGDNEITALTTIGDNVFYNCFALEELSLPLSVQTVGLNLIGKTSGSLSPLSIKTLAVPLSNGVNSYVGYYFGASDTLTQYRVFPSSLRTVIINEGTTVFPDNALNFNDYTYSYITTIVLASTISSVGGSTLFGNKRVENLTLPFKGNFNNLERYFGGNNNIPTTVQNIVLTDGSTSISNETGTEYGEFDFSSLRTIVIPYSVSVIPRGIFGARNDQNFTEITIPFFGSYNADSATYLKYYFGATSISDSVTINNALTTVNISEGTEYVDSGALDGSSYITNIGLPSTLVYAHNLAFTGTLWYQNAYTLANQVGSNEEDKFLMSNGILVRYFGEGVFAMDNENTLVVAENVKSILTYAFYGSAVKHIVFPYYNGNSLIKSIAYYAFSGATALESVAFDSSIHLTLLGGLAFYDTVSLTEVHLPAFIDEITKGAFQDCNNLTEITVPFNENYAENTASYLSYYFGGDDYTANSSGSALLPATLVTVNVAEGIKKIPDNAFRSANYVTEITIPSTIERIGLNAFTDSGWVTATDGLITKQINVEGDKILLSYIGTDTAVTIPSDIVVIADKAFYGNTLINQVLFAPRTKGIEIGDYAFANMTALDRVHLPADSICGISVFSGCTALNQMTAPLLVTSLGANRYEPFATQSYLAYYFGGSSYQDYSLIPSTLSKFFVPQGSLAVPEYAFYNVYSLETIDLPTSVEFIGNSAFYNCITLKSGTGIGESMILSAEHTALKIIEDRAFGYTARLHELYIPANVTYIGNSLLLGADTLNSLYLKLENGYNENTLSYISYLFGSVYNVVSSIPGTLTNITLLSGTTKIADNAFYGLRYITEVTFTDAVTDIGDFAFYNCSSLTTLNIKDAETIGMRSFYGCSALADFDVDNLTTVDFYAPNLVSLGKEAFIASGYLERSELYDANDMLIINGNILIAYNGSASSVIIPKEIEIISSFVFTDPVEQIYNEFVTSVSFEADSALSTVVDMAFYGLLNLTSIEFPAKEIDFGAGVLGSCSKLENLTVPLLAKFKENTASYILYFFGSTTPEAANANTLQKIKYLTINKIIPVTYVEQRINNAGVPYEVTLTAENVIPEKAFFNMSSLIAVTIPADITAIGRMAFYSNTSLLRLNSVSDEIDIGDQVISIGDSAFENASSILSVNISANTTNIGINILKGATSIASLTAPLFEASISGPSYISYYFGGTSFISNSSMPSSLRTFIIADGTTVIADDALNSANYLTTVEIPLSVTEIGERVLAGASNIATLKLVFIGSSYAQNTPSYLPYYFGGASYSAVSTISSTLRNVIVADGVTAIPSYAFFGASSLYTLVIPSSVVEIGTNILTGCTYLSNLTTPLSGAFAKLSYFYGGSTNNDYNKVEARLRTVNVQPQAGVTSIADYAFFTLKNITTVNLPDTIVSIGARAFYDCMNLTGLSLPDSLTSISDFAFGNCVSLTSLSLPEGAVNVANNILNGCSNLTALTVNLNGRTLSTFFGAAEGSLESRNNSSYVPGALINVSVYGIDIAPYAFNGLSSILSVEFLSQIESIGRYVFAGCTLLDLEGTIPATLTFVGDNAFSNTAWYDASSDLVMLGSVLVGYKGSASALDLSAYNITSIASFAFKDNTVLTSLILPDTLALIEDRAFFGCTNLASLTINAANQAFATVDNVLYKKDNDNYSLAYYPSGLAASSYTVLEQISTQAVSSIGNYAFDGAQLATLILTPAIISIDKYAFVGSDSLEAFGLSAGGGTYSVSDGVLFNGNNLAHYPSNKIGAVYNLPITVTSISDYAFYNAANLTEINLYGSVIGIGAGIFYGADSLTSVSIVFTDTVNSLRAFFTADESYDNSQLTQIPSSLITVNICEDVISVPDFAFSGCANITAINLPDSLTAIGEGAFANCSALSSLYISASVTDIESGILIGCNSLASLTVPLNNTGVQNYFFKYFFGAATPYATVTIPASLSEVTVSEGITAIPAYAFYALGSVVTVTLPDTLTTIGDYAFMRSSALQSITVPSLVTHIGDGAFAEVVSLKTVEFPAGLITVGKNVLQNSTAVISLKTPLVNRFRENGSEYSFDATNKRYIKYLFGGADYNFTSIPSGLKTMIIDNAETDILSYEFYGLNNIDEIVLPTALVNIGERAFMNASLTELSFDGVPLNFTLVGNALYNSGKTVLYAYATRSADTSIAIETTTTSIEDGVFCGAANLTSLILSDGLTSIGDFAFKDMSALTALIIPANSLTFIGESILAGAEALSDLSAPIDSYANFAAYYFGGSTSKDYASVPASLVKFTIEAPSTTIPYEAFFGIQNLSEIVIPSSVTSIEGGAFRACSSLNMFTLDASTSFVTDANGVLYTTGFLAIVAYPLASDLQEYTAPLSVTEIYSYAFSGANNLNKVTLGENVATVGINTFTAAVNLTEITLPLTDVYAPGTPSYLKYYFGGETYNSGTLPVGLRKVTVLSATKIAQFAFYFCTGLTEINIPDVTEIGASAFYGASSLTSFTIPSTVKKFGTDILKNANSLTSLTTPLLNTYDVSTGSYLAFLFGGNSYASSLSVPASLKTVTVNAIVSESAEYTHSLADFAFYGLNKISTVNLPADMTSIGAYAFYNATVLTGVNGIRSDLESVGEYAFANTSWLRTKSGLITLADGTLLIAANTSNLSIVIPATVEKISDYAFYGNNIMSTVTFASGSALSYVGDYSFANCSNLSSITLPNTITYLGEGAFSNDNKLISFAIPLTTEALTIGKNLLYNSNGITSLTVALKSDYADNTASYLRYFFGGSRYDIGSIPASLINVNLSEGMTAIPDYAFYHCNTLETINIPSTVTTIGENAFSYCFGLNSFNTSGSIYFKTDSNGVLLSYDGTVLYNYPAASSAVSYSVADGVQTIMSEAFYGADNLTSVALSSTVLSLGDNVFGKCLSLSEITVDNNNIVYFAENGVLYKNDGVKLYLICYPAKLADKDYGDMVGYQIKGGTEIISKNAFAYSSVSNVSVPDSVTLIENEAFFGASKLEYVTFNVSTSGLETVGDYAFYACTALKEIILPDAVNTIGNSAFRHCSALKSVQFPLGLTSVGTNVLANDSLLESVVLPLCSPYNAQNFSYLRYYFGGSSYQSGGDVPDSLKKVEITDGTTAIGDYAFYKLDSINEIILPASVISVGVNTLKDTRVISLTAPFASVYSPNNHSYLAYYFGGSSPADYLTIPQTLTTLNVIGTTALGDNAFYKAAYITIVTLCDITSIGAGAFSEMSSLTMLTMPNTLTSIGFNAFYKANSLNTIEVPTAVLFDNSLNASWNFYGATSIRNVSVIYGTDIPAFAFYNATFGSLSLGRISTVEGETVIDSTITSIGNGAFKDFRTLSNLIIPNTVVTIGTEILSGAVALTGLKTPMSGDFNYLAYFFGGATYEEYSKIPVALKSVEITLGNVDDNAFYKASTVNTVIINKSALSIGEKAFYASGITAIDIPASVTTIGADAFTLTAGLIAFTVEEENPNYYSYNDTLFGKNGTEYTLIAYPSAKIGASYIIGKGLETESETINVVNVLPRAFYGNIKLTQITVPISLISIDEKALINVVNLTAVNVDDGNVNFLSDSGILYKKDGAKLIIWNYPTKRPAGTLGSTAKGYVVPSTVKEIAPYAFFNASKLYNINFDSATSLEKIGAYAFYGVTSLIDVTLPVSLVYIGEYAFASMVGVMTVNLPVNGALEYIMDYAFKDMDRITTISVPSSVNYVGLGVLSGAVKLANLSVPIAEAGNTVNVYGIDYTSAHSFVSYYFGGANAETDSGLVPVTLTSLSLIAPSGAYMSLLDYAASNLINVKTLSISERVISISSLALSGLSSLEAIAINNATGTSLLGGYKTVDGVLYGNLDIGGTSYYSLINYPLKKTASVLNLNVNVQYIAPYSFYGSEYLTQIVFPVGTRLEIIGDFAFKNATALASIVIPQSVETIGVGILEGTTALSTMTVSLSSGVDDIYTDLTNGFISFYFGGNSYTDNNLLPASLKTVNIVNTGSIIDRAFYGCANIENVTLPATLALSEDVGEYIFGGCSSLASLNLPFGDGYDTLAYFLGIQSYADYYAAHYTEVVGLTSTVTYDATISGGYQSEIAVLFPDSLLTVTVSTVYNDSISDYAFFMAQSVSRINLPDGIDSLGTAAFAGLINITGIDIPASVSSIGNYAFIGCTELIEVVLTENSVLTDIGDYAFYGCSTLFASSYGFSLNLPSCLTGIGSYAFDGCGSIIITFNGATPPVIGGSAFANCNLTLYVPSDSLTDYNTALEAYTILSITEF